MGVFLPSSCVRYCVVLNVVGFLYSLLELCVIFNLGTRKLSCVSGKDYGILG